MQDKSQQEELVDEMLQKMRQELLKEMPADNATLDEIEEAVSRIGETLLPELQRKLINKRTRGKVRDNQSACACGKSARYKEMRKRTLVTVHGPVDLERPYYYCSSCRKGFAPLDVALGISRASTTTKVRLFATQVGAKEPFAEAAQTLLSLTGISLCASTVERITVEAGQQRQKAQAQQVKAYYDGRLSEPRGRRPHRLYVGMDGLMVPLREPWKKDKSRGDLSCRYGECKVGVVYEAKQMAGRDQRVRTHAYTATFGDTHAFGPELAVLARSQGYGFARERVVIGDGAAWIWQLAGRHFPEALQIVDFFHASEHLGAVAEAMFGRDSSAGRQWHKERQEDLLCDRLPLVLCAIAAWKPQSKEMYRLRRREFRYFRTNRERMRYASFRKKGYHIGSGVVESSCKHVVALRLDQAGMHWRPETAESVVRLRAALRSTYAPDLARYCAVTA